MFLCFAGILVIMDTKYFPCRQKYWWFFEGPEFGVGQCLFSLFDVVISVDIVSGWFLQSNMFFNGIPSNSHSVGWCWDMTVFCFCTWDLHDQ